MICHQFVGLFREKSLDIFKWFYKYMKQFPEVCIDLLILRVQILFY